MTREAESAAGPHHNACASPRCPCYQEGYAAGVNDGKLAAAQSDGVTLMHDLRIERALGHDWAFAWCPCGWATEVEYNPRSDTENDFKRAFHEHLKSARRDGSGGGAGEWPGRRLWAGGDPPVSRAGPAQGPGDDGETTPRRHLPGLRQAPD